MGPAPSDVLDDPKLEDLEEFYDDVSGETLPPSLTREARMEEIRFMQDWHVWEVRSVKECKEVAGKAPIGGRWADHNKGDAETPKIRCRWVAKDITKWHDDAMLAATPPLEAVRLLRSDLATRRRSGERRKAGPQKAPD